MNLAKYGCPVPKDFCSKGVIIYDQKGDYGAIGFNIPAGTPILAVYSGQAKSAPSTFLKTKTTYPGIALTNLVGNLEISYIYKGKSYNSIERSVNKGEILSHASSGEIENFKNINLIVSYYQVVSEKNKTLLKINPNELR